MAIIERTACLRFPRTPMLKNLQVSFTPRPDEVAWAQGYARTPDTRLALVVMLKCFQFLRHFPAIEALCHFWFYLGLPLQPLFMSMWCSVQTVYACEDYLSIGHFRLILPDHPIEFTVIDILRCRMFFDLDQIPRELMVTILRSTCSIAPRRDNQ